MWKGLADVVGIYGGSAELTIAAGARSAVPAAAHSAAAGRCLASSSDGAAQVSEPARRRAVGKFALASLLMLLLAACSRNDVGTGRSAPNSSIVQPPVQRQPEVNSPAPAQPPVQRQPEANSPAPAPAQTSRKAAVSPYAEPPEPQSQPYSQPYPQPGVQPYSRPNLQFGSGSGAVPDPSAGPKPEPDTAAATANRKTAYLTFDDGPSAGTERLLAILRRYGVKATFFVVGTTSDEGKALYRKIAEEGHTLGNHTFSHEYRSVYRSPQAFRKDVDKLNAVLEEATGRKPDILRYPGGSNNKLGRKFGGTAIMPRIIRDMRAQGYEYFDWSVSSTDAAAPVQERDVIVGSVLSAAQGQREAIVLMHDNARKTTTLEALPTVIEGLRKMGFTFDVLRRSTAPVHFLEVD